MRFVLFATLVLAATPVLAADAADSATGTFRSQSMTMNVKSAIAFHGPSFVDKSDAIIVAVSNARLSTDSIADYVDRRRVLETRIRNADNGVVYFEFKPDGGYRGMSYYFAPGNGCGYCNGEVVVNVRLDGNKLSGKLVDAEKERAFEITLVVPIMSDDHGAELPADGGAPGKALVAYHDALVKADRPALKAAMSRDQQQYWGELENGGKLGPWVHAMTEAHPTKAMAITRGYATPGKAVLLIAGDAASGKVVGEVLLLYEDGAWRVDDEITEPVRQ